jgi:peptide/nickel transport system substrate-binding protein
MSVRQRLTWLFSAVACAAGVLLLVTAFTATAAETSASASPAHSTSIKNLRVVLDAVDYLDPSQAYTGQSLWALWTVYEGLVTYRHVDGPGGYTVVPGLAAAMPKISRGGTVYTFTLRKNLKYSDGRPVRATDFECTLKRDFISSSPGVGFYEAIVGAKTFEKTLKGDIPGITADNRRRTIRIVLSGPRGDFMTILALPFAGFVPCGTPTEDQSGSPIAASGPYMIAPGADKNRSFTLLRNPKFKATRYIPRGAVGRVTVVVVGDANAAVQRVIGGSADYTNAAVPPERIAAVSKRGQLRLRAAANTYYFWMNTRIYPFNKLKVRQAVNYAIDRTALIRTVWGGLGKSTQNILPPTYPSYRRLSLYSHNLKKARALIDAAGVKGAAVTVYGRQVSDSVQSTTLYASYLNAIGLKADLKFLPRSTYYTTIGNAKTKAQTGWARWLEDYPHPLDWFDVLLNGHRIAQENNNNYAWYSNSRTNREIEALKRAPVLTAKVDAQWARVEREIMANAPWAPWSNRVFPEFFSKKIGCIHMQRLYGVDFMRLCAK